MYHRDYYFSRRNQQCIPHTQPNFFHLQRTKDKSSHPSRINGGPNHQTKKSVQIILQWVQSIGSYHEIPEIFFHWISIQGIHKTSTRQTHWLLKCFNTYNYFSYILWVHKNHTILFIREQQKLEINVVPKPTNWGNIWPNWGCNWLWGNFIKPIPPRKNHKHIIQHIFQNKNF